MDVQSRMVDFVTQSLEVEFSTAELSGMWQKHCQLQ